MTKPELTAGQLDALRSYANENGRTWKSKLRDDWERGRLFLHLHGAELQQIRNTLGPNWLNSFRLKGARRARTIAEDI